VIEEFLAHPGAEPALIAPAQSARLTYAELAERVERVAQEMRALAGPRGLVFLAPGPDVGGILLYLGVLRAGLPLCLAEPQAQALARLCGVYRPEVVLASPSLAATLEGRPLAPGPAPGYVAAVAGRADSPPVHPDLALLLTTSGSTGSPKLVRLTKRNLRANAKAIASYLGLHPGERAIQSLPMHYSYGLSVLNSHLVAGGSLVLTPHSFFRPEFWHEVDQERVTSFAGVPYMYETLGRLRFDPGRHLTVRTFTQAGGALRRDLAGDLHQRTVRAGARLVIMYGQTEATARISYVPPDRLPEKLGTIGIAVPGGRLRLEPLADGEASWSQLVYEGENVMLGYADAPEDLALGDVQGGVLRTGDLGAVDAEGFFSVVGRLKRFAKLYGRRVSLEDVEREVESGFPVRAMATEGDDRLVLHLAADAAVPEERVVSHIARFLAVPPRAITVRWLSELPLTASGKKDYKAAEAAR